MPIDISTRDLLLLVYIILAILLLVEYNIHSSISTKLVYLSIYKMCPFRYHTVVINYAISRSLVPLLSYYKIVQIDSKYTANWYISDFVVPIKHCIGKIQLLKGIERGVIFIGYLVAT